MANVERFGLFYAPWPVIDGKPINYQWGEIRHDTAETKAIVRNSFQELQDGQEELNALRALLGQAFGDLVFSNRYRFYYNKSTLEFCLQKNDGTVAVPVWTDVWCVRLSDGQLQIVSSGGIQSDAGFYGPDLERIFQIGESGSSAADESFLHRSKLFFNVDDGFELNEITSGGNQGGVEVKFTAPFGRAVEFPKVGKEWVVEHEFGISPVLVQVMDDDKRVIFPDLVDVSDPDIAYFYFNEVTSGSVYIASGGVGATSLLPLDPFYLVVRHEGQPAAGHTMEHNADLIFDSRFFYVNVDLDEDGGGSHKNAFISFIPQFSGSPVTALQGDRNIAASVAGDTGSIRLQPKLSGMEAFYFANGDALTHGESLHFEVQGQVQMRLGKSGLKVEDKVKAESFYLESGHAITNVGGGSLHIEVGGKDRVLVNSGSDTLVSLKNENVIAPGGPSIGLSLEDGEDVVFQIFAVHDPLAGADTKQLNIYEPGTQVVEGSNANRIVIVGPGVGKSGFTPDVPTTIVNNQLALLQDGKVVLNAGSLVFSNYKHRLTVDGGDVQATAFYLADSGAFVRDGATGLPAIYHRDSVVATFGRDGVKVKDKVKAGGFYLTPGANNTGHDLGQQDIQFDIPTAEVTSYYLDNFVSQGYVVLDVALATQDGNATVGFYILTSNEVRPRGIGIASAPHTEYGNLGNFYVAPKMRKLSATSANVMSRDSSLVMSVFENTNAIHLRGRVRISLSG